jgi:RHS repeat-associated protein
MTSGPGGVMSYLASGVGSVRPHAPLTAGATTFGWRGDGRMTSQVKAGVTLTYSWNGLGQLSQVTKTGVVQADKMWYLAGGERVLLQDAGGVHLFLGGMMERHSSAVGVKTEKRYYTLGSQMVAVRTTTTGLDVRDYVLGDVRGSSSMTIRRNTVSGRQEQYYSPYGAKRGAPVITATSRGYIGQTTDATTGLNYLRNRYQDPASGVFISVDPLVQQTGEAYLYAGGNPSTLKDPTGLYKSGDDPDD